VHEFWNVYLKSKNNWALNEKQEVGYRTGNRTTPSATWPGLRLSLCCPIRTSIDLMHVFCCNLKLLVLILLLSLLSAPSQADWINLTGAENAANIAEIYIMDDHIRMVLEIFWSDIEIFKPLTLDNFSAIQFVTEEGKKLKLIEIPLFEPRLRIDRYSPFSNLGTNIPGAMINRPPDDKRVYYAELIFELKGHPKTITINPPKGSNSNALVNIGFLLFHKNVPVVDFRYLSANETLYLDWDDPWYTKFENINLDRHHKSALTSYLYVEPFEVRHEILIRPKDLMHWLDLQLADDKTIDVNELQPLLKRVSTFLMQKNPLTIDGQTIRPILDQAEYVNIGRYGIQNFAPTEKLELNTAIIGVMLSYLSKSMPEQVEMKWQLFSEKINMIPATVTDPAGPFITYLSPDENTLIWKNYLKDYVLPKIELVMIKPPANNTNYTFLLLALVLISFAVIYLFHNTRFWLTSGLPVVMIIATLLTGKIWHQETILKPLLEDDAALILETLLKNIYKAFQLHNEEDVYDKLALTVDGALLEQVYLQQRQAFAMQNAGGAQAKVNRVKLLDNDFQTDSATSKKLIYHARWTAEGAVSHWGHTHKRTNLYEALVTLFADEGKWKISSLKILNEKRLQQGMDNISVPLP